MNRPTLLLFLFISACCTTAVAQSRSDNGIDSAIMQLKAAKKDSDKLMLLNAISWNLSVNDPSTAKRYADTAIALIDSLLKLQQRPEFAEWLHKNTALFDLIIGDIYYNTGDYPNALRFHLNALRIGEETKNLKLTYYARNNMGLVFSAQANYEEAIKNYKESLRLGLQAGDSTEAGYSYSNIAGVYAQQNNYAEALTYFMTATKIFRTAGQLNNEAQCIMNTGIMYSELGQYDLALDNLLRGLEKLKAVDDQEGIASTYNALGNIYSRKGRNEQALDYHLKALTINKKINARSALKDVYENIAKDYASKNDFKNAYAFYRQFSELKDSLLNEGNTKQIAHINAQYESDKKDNQIKLLNKDKEKQAAIASAESRKQQIIIWSVLGGLLMLTVFSTMLFNRFRLTSRQKKIIEDQKALVEEKNKSITDSINYAGRIQRSLLPSQGYIEKNLNKIMTKEIKHIKKS